MPTARPAALLPFLALTLAVVAASRGRADLNARQIVEAARRVHGATVLDREPSGFVFRGDFYRVEPLGGRRQVTRITPLDGLPAPLSERVRVVGLDDGGTVWREEPETSDGERGRVDTLRGDAAARVAASIGSVVYFALLPHGLADPAVRLRRLPDDVLHGRTVRTVEVTFDSTGGGRSWRDRYVYWFDAAHSTLDAFAYDYADGDGETRLRLATRAVTVGGVRFQSYATYTDPAMKGRIEHYLRRLGAPTLRKVSDVNLDTLVVGDGFHLLC